MPLLVSLCNQAHTPQCSLLLLDEITEVAQWVTLPEGLDTYSGCTGITRVGNLTYVLTQASVAHLLVFNNFFEHLAMVRLPKVVDGHSLCFCGGYLYIVSTGSDAIFRLRLDENGLPTGDEEFYWRHPESTGGDSDSVHLNSITVIDSELVTTCFGPKVNPETWKTTKAGVCLYVGGKNNAILDGLYHPHTAHSFDGGLTICDSSECQFVELTKGAGGFVVKRRKKFRGYIRGVAAGSNSFFIGQSEGRKKSRSRGTPNLPEDIHCEEAKVFVLSKSDFTVEKEISISRYGAEIYDLCYLDSVPFVIHDTAVVERISFLELLVSSEATTTHKNICREAQEGEVERLKVQNVKLQQALEEAKREIIGLRGSYSWRLTSPLRRVADLIK